MKRLIISIFLSFIFCVTLSMLTFGSECRDIRESVFRLHILANSDSSEDQQLKLKVRDRILAESEHLFSDNSDLEEAVESANSSLDFLESIAKDEIIRNGYDYDVSISVENTYFNTRTYGNITLPAGEYTALRIVIGEGAGHNWWCVMFPPICVSPSTDGVSIEDILNKEQLDIVEGDRYELRFKCLEYFEELFSKK